MKLIHLLHLEEKQRNDQTKHDINGPQADNVLNRFHEKCVTYHLLKLSKKQNIMIKKFKEIQGTKNIFNVHEMTKSFSFKMFLLLIQPISK